MPHHALPQQKKENHQDDTNRNLPIPNRGDFRPGWPVVFESIAIRIASPRHNATWLDGTQQQERTFHAFDDLFRDRSEDHRAPTRDAVRGNHNHIDMLSFDTSMMFPATSSPTSILELALIPLEARAASQAANRHPHCPLPCEDILSPGRDDPLFPWEACNTFTR